MVISHKEAFDGYLDTIIGEVFFFSAFMHIITTVIWRIFSSGEFNRLKITALTFSKNVPYNRRP